MTTDAINTAGALVYVYPELTVLLGTPSGTPPGGSSTFDNVYCSRVVQSAGGSRLDYAELTYSLSDYLTDRDQPDSFSRMVEIRMPDGPKTLLHRGDYCREAYRITQSGETLAAQSQMRSYHFGTPVKGYDVWSPLAGAKKTIDDDIPFNPTIDDKTLFNMSSKTRTDGLARIWTHPETSQTTVSKAYQGVDRKEWTLRRAVESMCEWLNPSEEFVRNPTLVELLPLAGAPVIRNLMIPLGTKLPKALDMLLIPRGYNWYVDYDLLPAKPKITIFKIGDGEEKTLFFQAPGESLNLETSNTNQLAIENDIGDSFNQVRVLGQFEEVEVTLPLYPAWDSANDALTAEDLVKSGTEYEGKETVHRMWIANEAGDLDPAIFHWGMNATVPNLSTVFTTWLPHRRPIREPLTYIGGTKDPNSQRRPVMVEYSTDTGATWLPCDDTFGIKLLPDQIGILFDADSPPEDLVTAGSTGRVRITGTIFGDRRVEGLALKQTYSANGRTVEEVISVSEKFQSRWRNTAGPFRSVFLDQEPSQTADERDDTEEIQAYAELIRNQNHYAEVDCEFRLPGWHLEYKIGDLISKVEGRELNLDASPASAPVFRFPQIVQRHFENGEGGPSTVLIVDRGIDTEAVARA